MFRVLIAVLLAAATVASPSVPHHTTTGSVRFLSSIPNNNNIGVDDATAPPLPPPPTLLSAVSPPVGPIRRWLANLTFSVPNLSVTVGASIFETTVNLTKLVCHHVQLSSISLPPPTPASSPTAITLGVHGLGVSCYGLWATRQHDWPHAQLSGTVNVSVGGDTGVRIGVDVHRRKDDGLPGTVVPTDCGANLTIADVTFHGDGTGILNPVLDLLKPAIGKAAAGAVCPPNNLTGSVAGGLATALTKVFNDSDSKIAPFLKPVPPAIPPPVGPGMFNLQDNSLVRVLDNILDNLLGYKGINGIIDFFTHPNNGTVSLSKMFKNKKISFNVSNIAMVTLGLDDLVLHGLDTWSMFDFFRPVSKYSLNSVSATDNLAVNLTFNVRVEFIGPKVHSSVLYESGVLFMNLTHNVLNTTMQVAVRKAPMEALTPRQVANTGCLLSTVADFNLTQLTLNTSVRNLSLVAVAGNVEKDFDAAIDAVLGLAVHAFGPSIPAYLNGAVIEQLRLLANEAVANASATAKCKADTSLEPLTYDPVWIKIAFCGCAFLSLVLGLVLWRNACRWDRGLGMEDDGAREALLSVNGGGSLQAGAGAGATAFEDHRRKTASLAMQTAAAWYWRYGVPFLLWMCAAMFITSNTGVGAGVYITLNLDGHILKLPSVFSFTLGNSVKQMWQAGVYPLSILVATFSGTWPYAKLVMMMVTWVCPVRYLPVRVREGMLMFLDKFGKWSLLDSFILLFMVVGFHVNVPLAATSSVDVFVEPGFGTYFLLGSTILSLLLTHVVLHFHRQNTAGYAVLSQSGADQPSRSLYRQVTEVSFPVVQVRRRRSRARNGRDAAAASAAAVYEGEGLLSGTDTDTDTCADTDDEMIDHRVTCTPSGSSVMLALLCVSFGMVVYGAYVDSFAFEFRGAAAVAMEEFGAPVFKPHSLISVARGLPASSDTPNGFGIRLVQASFFVFALIIPLVQIAFLFVLFIVSATPAVTHLLYTIAEILRAWSALDVFVLALVATVYELEDLSQFIVGSRCDAINRFLKQWFDKQLHGDDKCFDLVATVGKGTWVLFVACAFAMFVTRFVMHLSHEMLEDMARRASGAQEEHARIRWPSCFRWCCCRAIGWVFGGVAAVYHFVAQAVRWTFLYFLTGFKLAVRDKIA